MTCENCGPGLVGLCSKCKERHLVQAADALAMAVREYLGDERMHWTIEAALDAYYRERG
jgi:hypothetical protein